MPGESPAIAAKSAVGCFTGGSLLPGRNYSSSTYNYGFNGMRKDDEIHGATGTSYDFGARLYDPRVGRWLSLDPLAAKYPYLSPYAFTANNPILFVDVDGRDFIIKSRKDQRRFMAALRVTFGDNAAAFKFDKSGMLSIDMEHVHGLSADQKYVVTQFNSKIVADRNVTVELFFSSKGVSETFDDERYIEGGVSKFRAKIRVNTSQPFFSEKMHDTESGNIYSEQSRTMLFDAGMMDDGREARTLLPDGATPEQADAIDGFHELGHIIVFLSTRKQMRSAQNFKMTVGFENVVRRIFGMEDRVGKTHGETRKKDGTYEPKGYQGSDAPPPLPTPEDGQ